MPRNGSGVTSQPSAQEQGVRRNHSEGDDVIGALGDALAGVNFDDHSHFVTNSIFRSNATAVKTGMPRGSNAQAYRSNHITRIDSSSGVSWGTSANDYTGFSVAFPTASGFLNRTVSDVAAPTAAPSVSSPGTGPFTARSLPPESRAFFGNTPISEQTPDLPTQPDSFGRKQSLDIFLSQSPAQSLCTEFLQLGCGSNLRTPEKSLASKDVGPLEKIHQTSMQRRNEIPVSVGNPHNQVSLESGLGKGSNRRPLESPSCSMTATSSSSRSASPSAQSSSNLAMRHQNDTTEAPIENFQATRSPNHIIPSFTGYTVPSSPRIMSGNDHAHALNPKKSTHADTFPFGENREQTSDTNVQSAATPRRDLAHVPYAPPENGFTMPNIGSIAQLNADEASISPQQVFYVAVPTHDGRQVLQPIQMIQVPGQPSTFVMPAPTTSLAAGSKELSTPLMFGHSGIIPASATYMGNNVVDLASGNRNAFFRDGSGTGRKERLNSNESFQYAYGTSGTRHDLANVDGRPQRPTISGNDAVIALYNASQRPPLESLLGHVRRLSRDQVGCRLLQQALDDEGPNAASQILNEGLSFWGDAMVDPFGNYLFQKILEKVTPEERIVLVQSVSTRLVNASLNLHGTRSVQKVVETCSVDELSTVGTAVANGTLTAAGILTRSLAPSAARLCIDSHGNHVIQRILLKLPHQYSNFVFEAVANSVGDVARHRHGCCVIQRCLDSAPSPARSKLVQRIVEKALDLMQDAYGNYVVQYVLDVCGDEEVHAVCESVIGNVNLLAIQKFSSNVMEKCFERCSDRVRELYMQELSDPDRIRELMMDPFGNYVVQRALTVATHSQAVRLVEAMRPHLMTTQPGSGNGHHSGGMRNTAGGRRIMTRICRRFPNFNLSTEASAGDQFTQNRTHHRSNTTQASAIYSSPNMKGSGAGNRRTKHSTGREVKSPSGRSHGNANFNTIYRM